MWHKGIITVDGQSYKYCIKSFDVGSVWGIKNGKISKLGIIYNGKTIVNYDRGWDIKPAGKEVKRIYKALLAMFN